MPTFGGPWTLEKLEILERYLDSYTTALKDRPFKLTYVDAFAGDGTWQPSSGYATDVYGEFAELLEGSARIALEVRDKPFDRCVFIEKDRGRSESLRDLAEQYPDRRIDVIPDDANTALPSFCNSMSSSDRAVVFLDPYATQVAWETVEAVARTQKIDCWILFPLMAISRMMPTDSEPSPSLKCKLDVVFGGRDRWEGIYQRSSQLSMFGDNSSRVRASGSDLIAEQYRARLESAFDKVAPTERTFVNSTNSPMFKLFFAASNPIGASIAVRIANHILENL